jgi:mono/diheme cytochrome c family protein
MISGRMTRPLQVASTFLCLAAASMAVSACGTQKISVPRSNAAAYEGAVLFSQRCSGCHTLSFAGTHGSATNIRDRQSINGPNFNQRCERPVDRVLYAIENGGFSGAYMPQNIVVGQDAREVALFVAQYAGRQTPPQPGVPPCTAQPIGTLPAATATGIPVVQTGTGTSTSAVAAAPPTSTGSTTSTTPGSGGASVTGGG